MDKTATNSFNRQTRSENLWARLLDFLFPPRCCGCKRHGSLFCKSCRANVQLYPHKAHIPFIDRVVVGAIFAEPLRSGVHLLKYRGVDAIARPLSSLFIEQLHAHQEDIDPATATVLIPVPLHPNREAERGFNQSELLARELSQQLGLALHNQGLIRIRDTPHQVGMDVQARQSNVSGAFVWQSQEAPPAHSILVDDILTTGATLSACAQALRAVGVTRIDAWTLARPYSSEHSGEYTSTP